MKTSIKKYPLIFVFSTFFFVGCDKFLDVSPDMRTELNSVDNIGEFLASAYPEANHITFTEAISDNVSDKGSGSLQITNSSPYLFQDVANIDQDSPTYYWNACYKAISTANHALEAIEKANNKPEYLPYKGEALVARAYAHFMLVILFAQPYEIGDTQSKPGIPYVTEPGKVVFGKYSRGTVASVYEAIEKDLLEGIPLLNDAVYKSPKYHFTTSAAHAFASRFYLFKKSYHKVIEHANQVFPSGNIKANLRVVNSQNYRSLQYREAQALYTKADNPANLLLASTKSLWGRSFPGFRYGLTTGKLNEIFQAPNITTGVWSYNVYGSETSLNIPKFREHFVKLSINAEIGEPYNMVPLFTSEEVLFNRAEANAALGNYDLAIQDLNDFASTKIISDYLNPVYNPIQHEINRTKLMAFYNTGDMTAALYNCILDFKQVNFLFEGMRWFDIIRHNLSVKHETTDRGTLILSPSDPMRVFQIPQEAQSSGIELNPRN